jgi:glycosyltransferase involved in cell wall biosynthesis
VLTAYAFNKPVIVTNVGGLPEYVWEGKTGFIVPPNDPERLAETIIKYLRKRSSLKNRNESMNELRKNELSWNRSAERTAEIYEKILRAFDD